MYADTTYYFEQYGGKITSNELERLLQEASDDIDILTHYRIERIGFDKLTEFQQTQLKKVCCRQADFRSENADVLNTPLNSYSINGVSMSMGNTSYYGIYSGVAMDNTTYKMLQATGLTTDMIFPSETRWWV